jgi:hypothetical protein
MTRRRRQLRLAVAIVLPLIAILVLITISSENGEFFSAATPALDRTRSAALFGRSTVALRLRERRIGTLPAPLQDAAAVPFDGGGPVLLGGLDSSDTSTTAIMVINEGHVSGDGQLLEAQHDAQGAELDGAVYVFGGGQFSSYDHILRFNPANGRMSVVGHLPQPASDVAVTSIGNTAYIIGGYNGERALDTIIAWRPGSIPRIVGRLPVGLRYAAVAAVGSRVIIAGGSTEAGASRAILSFDPSSGRVGQIGSLPHPLTHASAASVHATVFVIGGRSSAPGSQTAAILAIDPGSGRVHNAGALGLPLSDAAVAATGGHIVLAGGQSASGTQSSILELVLAIG